MRPLRRAVDAAGDRQQTALQDAEALAIIEEGGAHHRLVRFELRDDGKIARLHIDYHGVKTHFTTDNVNAAPDSIRISLKEGPFRSLAGAWTFKALAADACKVELVLSYTFGTSLLEAAVGPVFDRIARTFIDAFVHRAEALHGASRR